LADVYTGEYAGVTLYIKKLLFYVKIQKIGNSV